MAGAARLSTGGITFFVPAGIAGPSIGVYDFFPVGRGGPSTGEGSIVIPMGIPKPSTGGVTTVDPVGRAFLIDPRRVRFQSVDPVLHLL